MAKVKKVDSDSSDTKPLRPAITLENREEQLVTLALDLVEKRLREGTASSQETTHFLKQATVTAQLEKEKLRKENLVLEAKAKAYNDDADRKRLYEEAIKAMRRYSGQGGDDDEYDEDEDY